MNIESMPEGAEPGIERRLATILMADVAGYSRMMGENEERTVQTLRGHRAIFDALLKTHRGRIFNTAGDAILAEFPSAVEAVRCATEIQTALRTRNDHLLPEERMWFRIGINLGDVIVQGGDLLGDGVNVAARIQTIAEPGGVCLAGSVYDQIQNKLSLQFRQLGEKSFKNIAQPIRTFSIVDGDALAVAGPVWRRLRKGPAVAVAGVLLGVIAVAAGAWLYRDYSERAADEARRGAEAQRVAEALRKSEQEKSVLANSEREAKLMAELQSAKDALTQAEVTKRKAEQDRSAAETAQREARLQTELRSAKDAQQRAEAQEKKAEDDRKAAAEALRVATAAAANSAVTRSDAKAESGLATGQLASSKPAADAGGGLERFDGAYAGRMCSLNADGSPRCWKVALSAKHGTLAASWTARSNNLPAHAKGTISAEGEVKLALDGHNSKGTPMTGSATGRWENNKIMVAGEWSNKVPVDATWTWSSSDPEAAIVAGPTGKGDDAGFNGRGSHRFR